MMEVVKARLQAIPNRTKEDTAYCIRVWEEWAQSRLDHGVQVQPLMSMDDTTLQYWLTHFILEVRMKNGQEYPLYITWSVALCVFCGKMEDQKLTFSKTVLLQTFKILLMQK